MSETTDTDQAGSGGPGGPPDPAAQPTPSPGAAPQGGSGGPQRAPQADPNEGPPGDQPSGAGEESIDYAQLDVESLVAVLETVTAERDSHLADLQRVSAEFSNFRRQATKRQTDTVEHAASGLAGKLLPILDACDAALLQGATDVEPIQLFLIETLRKEGLEVLTESGEAFDPERHEAVMHEEGDETEPTVAEVMRAGYVWNGRVLRPAMVRVRG